MHSEYIILILFYSLICSLKSFHLLKFNIYKYHQKNHKQVQMTQEESHEKKHFTVPNKEELIDQIKNLDQDIQHISLNLIKCDFNATQKDVEKAFPDFKFIKVKNYNPGSFQIVLQMRIDAINFIKTQYDKKILNRRFFIKMGRQHKQLIEDWTGVGYAPRQFRHPNKNHNKDHQNKDNQNKDQKKEHRQPREFKKHNEHRKPEEKKQQAEEQVKVEVKPKVEQPVKQENVATQKVQQIKQVKKGKQIPKTDYHKKNNNYNKPKGDQANNQKKVQPATQQIKQEKPVQKTEQKKIEKPVTNTKPVEHKQKSKPVQEAVKPAEKVAQKAKVQEKEQDDGWIVVPPKNNAKQKKR